MKTLSKTIRKYGDILRQIKRSGLVAIYSRGNSFKVIVIQQNKEWAMNGNVIPASESYPSSEMWGSKGFTCMDRDAAERKFAELVAKLSGLTQS